MVKPRLSRVPKGNGDLGDRAVVLAHDAGLELDEWQQLVLRASLGKREDGRWAASKVGVNVARQNGKGGIIEARILAELYLVKSGLTIYSAHNFDTALEHFRRVAFLIENTPRLLEEVVSEKGKRHYGITWGKGNEGIELEGNRRLGIRTRTAGGGRGFSCDCLFLDEAMFISEFMHGALRPVLSARPNPQVWYLGSAVDQTVHDNGVVFSRLREHAIENADPDLAYFEWSVEGDNPDFVPPGVMNDKAAWAQANPALGLRIDPEYVAGEQKDMSRRTFAVERLGIGDWPRTDHVASILDLEAWDELTDSQSELGDSFCLAFDVSPDRRGSISAAGKNGDGLWHIEVIEDKAGTGWLPARLQELTEKHHPRAIVCDGYGPAGALIGAIEESGLEVTTLTATEHAQACGQLVDAIQDAKLCHLGDDALRSAIQAAQTRPLGDAWAWSRKNSSGNISPLVSATLALSAAIQQGDREWSFVWA